LSRPRLVCQSGKEAELLVGGEVPNLTTSISSSSGSQTTEVEYKEYGIKLTINPIVTATSQIKIALDVEVSDIEPVITIGAASAPTAKAYPITKRNTSTELILNDFQTLVIGGLIKEKKSENIKKLPFLSSLSILGALFRNKENISGGGDNSDTELVIALTPSIIDPNKDKINSQSSTEGDLTTKNNLNSRISQKNRVSKAILNNYIQLVAEKIKNAFIYPADAKEQKQEGSVQLAIQLSSSGQVLDAKITQPSGYECLDTNALKVARQASPYPSFPSEIESEDLWLNVPIVYNLK
ncbi:MAG: TonB family protein, partial [Candidatus Omnitrophica bacterium]|nr:TonB family protein [Candidatus Omnitrophota bacterium]